MRLSVSASGASVDVSVRLKRFVAHCSCRPISHRTSLISVTSGTCNNSSSAMRRRLSAVSFGSPNWCGQFSLYERVSKYFWSNERADMRVKTATNTGFYKLSSVSAIW